MLPGDYCAWAEIFLSFSFTKNIITSLRIKIEQNSLRGTNEKAPI